MWHTLKLDSHKSASRPLENGMIQEIPLWWEQSSHLKTKILLFHKTDNKNLCLRVISAYAVLVFAKQRITEVWKFARNVCGFRWDQPVQIQLTPTTQGPPDGWFVSLKISLKGSDSLAHVAEKKKRKKKNASPFTSPALTGW